MPLFVATLTYLQQPRFATRCNFAFRKCTNHQNHALGSLYAQKCTIFRCNLPPPKKKRSTFANVVGSYAINVPPTCLQSRPTHPVISAFYTILLMFSWDIGLYYVTPPLTAEKWLTDVCKPLFCIISPKVPQKSIIF